MYFSTGLRTSDWSRHRSHPHNVVFQHVTVSFYRPKVPTKHSSAPVYIGNECQEDKGTRQSRNAANVCTAHNQLRCSDTKKQRMPRVRGYKKHNKIMVRRSLQFCNRALCTDWLGLVRRRRPFVGGQRAYRHALQVRKRLSGMLTCRCNSAAALCALN